MTSDFFAQMVSSIWLKEERVAVTQVGTKRVLKTLLGQGRTVTQECGCGTLSWWDVKT